MASLLDIGPLTEDVDVHGVTLTVRGLTAGHIFQLFSEFPDMRKLFETGADRNPQEVMLSLAPDLFAKIIAIATGDAGNKEAEEKVKTMGASEQLTLLAAVQRLTFKDGIGPFIDRVSALMGSMMPAEEAMEPNSSGNSASSTTPLRSRSSALLQTDTPNLAHGRAPRVN
jgi:hypothetical protein